MNHLPQIWATPRAGEGLGGVVAGPPQISLLLKATLTCAFGLAAGMLVALTFDAPDVTAGVLALSSGLALRRRRS